MLILGCVSGVFFVFGIVWFFQKKQKDLYIQWVLAEERNKRIPLLEEELQEKEQDYFSLQSKYIAAESKLALSQQEHQKLTETFKALSSEVLEKNNRSFLDLAQATLQKYQEGAKGELEKRHQSIVEMMTPVKETLLRIDQDMKLLEKERKGDQESLKEHLKILADSEKHLRQETSSLVKALRTPIGRGRWGEVQLKRVVELAGMLSHCDFYEQQSKEGEESSFRPDLIVKLPGGRQVIVDAKVPLDAYLEAMQTQDDTEKESKLKDHSRQVRKHLSDLSKKAYWEHFQPTPELVILFLPSESFFSAALEYDPSLLEAGAEQRVIIATPTTLIALLRAIAYGWKQESLSRHAEEVSKLGHELYKRLVDMGGHWSKMGKSLSSAVESYNKAVGSLESRVFVTARKFKDMGAASSYIDFEELSIVDKIPRAAQVAELLDNAVDSSAEEVS